MKNCCKLYLPVFQDARGILTAIEGGQDIPFEIKRVFTITGGKGLRGGHVNPGSYVLWAVQGSCSVLVEDICGNETFHGWTVAGSGQALYTPANTAVNLSNFSDDCVILVLSDWHYKDARP